ncbi:MAG: type II toxin-antitoxin system RelE/ParE family toxin [Sulfuricurvum sp.]
MELRQLEWSRRAQADRQKIAEFYASEASPFIAEQALISIKNAANRILKNPLNYREGKKARTREYVMRRFPYIVIYQVSDTKISIIRVLHQAMRYFN